MKRSVSAAAKPFKYYPSAVSKAQKLEEKIESQFVYNVIPSLYKLTPNWDYCLQVASNNFQAKLPPLRR